MRIAKLSPAGSVEEIVMEDLCLMSAEIQANKFASRQPGVFFAVIPDDAEVVLSIAHKGRKLKAA